MAITSVTGTVVGFETGSFVDPSNATKRAGVIFRIRFASGADLNYGVTFSTMQTLINLLGLDDPGLLHGISVDCAINDNLQITDAVPA